jgi:hypothetical protein
MQRNPDTLTYKGPYPEPFAAEVIDAPSIAALYKLAALAEGTSLPLSTQGIEFLMRTAHGTEESLSPEELETRTRIETRTGRKAEALLAEVSETVRRLLSGDGMTLCSVLSEVGIVFRLVNVPVWFAAEFDMEGNHAGARFFQDLRFEFPADLESFTVEPIRGMPMTAARLLADTLRVVETAVGMLAAAGVPEDLWRGLFPVGVTGEAVWRVSLMTLKVYAADMPDRIRLALEASLREEWTPLASCLFETLSKPACGH